MRAFRTLLAVVATSAMICPSQTPAQESKSELPNDMSIELLGRCLIYAFTYQRCVTPNLGLELGGSLLGGSDGSVVFISGGARFYPSRRDATPCISAGIVAVTASQGSGPFSSDNSSSYGYIGPGFEYRSSGGFLLRGTVYVLVRDGFFVWPGAQMGIAF